MRQLFTLLFGLLILHSPVLAQVSDSAFPPGKIIDTRMDLGLFGLLGGGMQYSIQGRPISRYEDFKAVIASQGDEESLDLIRSAESAHFAAWMLYVTGAAVGVDVALSFKPATLLGVDWIDRAASGFVGAQVFWAMGALLDTGAEGRKYNAIERYNRSLRSKEDTAWDLTPPQLAFGPTGARCLLGARF